MKTKIMMQVLSAALIIQIAFLPDFAVAQADFYRGKTVTIIHGRSVGGSGEMRARAARDQEGRDCVFRIC
jgi:hypothetical protein